jgi:hypothetical protein
MLRRYTSVLYFLVMEVVLSEESDDSKSRNSCYETTKTLERASSRSTMLPELYMLPTKTQSVPGNATKLKLLPSTL